MDVIPLLPSSHPVSIRNFCNAPNCVCALPGMDKAFIRVHYGQVGGRQGGSWGSIVML